MGEYQKTINRFFRDSAVCIAGYYIIVIPVVCYLLIHEGFSYIDLIILSVGFLGHFNMVLLFFRTWLDIRNKHIETKKVIIQNIEFDSRYNLTRANKYMRYRLTSTEDEKFSICPENWAFHWPNLPFEAEIKYCVSTRIVLSMKTIASKSKPYIGRKIL